MTGALGELREGMEEQEGAALDPLRLSQQQQALQVRGWGVGGEGVTGALGELREGMKEQEGVALNPLRLSQQQQVLQVRERGRGELNEQSIKLS